MKLLCLTTNLERPSTKYRLRQYLPYLAEAGIDSQVSLMATNWQRFRLLVVGTWPQCQGLFIQKKLLSPGELLLIYYRFKKQNKKIIYDYDDAVIYGKTNGAVIRRREQRFHGVLKIADLIIAGNDYLAARIPGSYRAKTRIVPTVLPVARYKEKDYQINRRDIIIGWIGTRSTLAYLQFVIPVLIKLQARYPNLRCKIVSDQKPDVSFPGLIYEPWQEDREGEQLRSFDIGIMPLPPGPWAEGKCGFKLIQYGAVAIPSVCSPRGVNKGIINNGVTGFWAESAADWENSLERLIKDKDLRQQLGRRARQQVENKYNLSYWGPYLAQQIKEILGLSGNNSN